MATAAIYIRVSTEDQARHGYSLREQEESCRQYAAEKLGVKDPIVIADEGVSGGVLNRPGIERLLAVAREVDHVICKDPDRLARNLAHQLLITERIERAGAKLHFVDFERAPTPEGQLFYAMRGAIAEYEKAKITSRLMAGKWQKAKQGGLPTRIVMYGYDQVDGQLVINPAEAAVVRQIYDWFLHGWPGKAPPPSPYQIAQRLNSMGLRGKNGGRFWASTIQVILTSPAYNGRLYLRRYNTEGEAYNRFRPPEERVRRTIRPRSEWIEVPVPPIIDDATWQAAQRMYKLLGRIRPQAPRVRYYMLSGLGVCGFCGASMVGSSHLNPSGKRRNYYGCRRRNQFGTCDMPYAPAEEIEERVWETVCAWIEDPQTLLEALESDSDDKAQTLREETEAAIERVKQERKRLVRLYQSGLVPMEDIESQLEELRARETLLLEQLANLPSATQPLDKEKVAATLAELRPALAATSPQERAEVCRRLIERVIFRGKAGPRRRDPHIIEIIPRQIP